MILAQQNPRDVTRLKPENGRINTSTRLNLQDKNSKLSDILIFFFFRRLGVSDWFFSHLV